MIFRHIRITGGLIFKFLRTFPQFLKDLFAIRAPMEFYHLFRRIYVYAKKEGITLPLFPLAVLFLSIFVIKDYALKTKWSLMKTFRIREI